MHVISYYLYVYIYIVFILLCSEVDASPYARCTCNCVSLVMVMMIIVVVMQSASALSGSHHRLAIVIIGAIMYVIVIHNASSPIQLYITTGMIYSAQWKTTLVPTLVIGLSCA